MSPEDSLLTAAAPTHPVDETAVPAASDSPGASPPLDPPILPVEPEDDQPPRRRRLRRILGWVVGTLVIGSFIWALMSVFMLSNAIDRIPAAELPSLDQVGTGPTNFLLVGTDSREDLPSELGNFFGEFGGERADVIMLLHVHDGRLQMVSLPRDLRVDIPGRGADRINAAYAYGGPDLLVATVKQATGLPIHHYLEVRFGEFAGVVDALGGVPVEFAHDARDGKSGLAVTAGTEELNGAQAVSYVRSREYEELIGGAWVAVDQGDIARTARQQQVVNHLLGSVTSPSTFPSLPFTAGSLGRSLRADAGLTTGTLLRLGWSVMRAGETETGTLPTRNAPAGGVAYLATVEPGAANLLAAFGRGDSLLAAG